MTSTTPLTSENLAAHARWLRGLTRSLVTCEHRADEIMQETMLAALRGRGRPIDSVRSWLAQIARNLARRLPVRDNGWRVVEVGHDDQRSSPPVDVVVERAERQRSVSDAVLALDEPYRTTILLRFLEELTTAEIAVRTATPVETVRTRIKRGLETLRRRLDAEYGNSRAWAVPILGSSTFIRLAGSTPVGISLTSTFAVGMMAKLWVSAAVAVLAGISLWAVWPNRTESVAVSDREEPVQSATTGAAGTESTETRLDRLQVDTAASDANNSQRNRGRIGGRVIWGKDGSPVRGAIVQLLHREADAFEVLPGDYDKGVRELGQCTTAADGSFELPVQLLRMFRLKVTAAGYAPVVRTGIPGGAEILVRLQVPASLRITVTADGKPVAAAKLRLTSTEERVDLAKGHTDVDGTCYFSDLCQSKAYLQTIAPGYGEGWTGVDLQAGEEQRIHVRLRAGREVRGRVLSKATGKPIVGAEVADSFEFDRTVRTGADGRFRLRGAGPKNVWLFVRAKGFADSTRGLTAESVEDVVVLLASGGTVTGRLMGANGKAPQHVYCGAMAILVESNGRSMTEYPAWVEGHVEPSGHFRVSGLRPARHYWIYVCGRGYGTRVYALPRALDNDQSHEMGTLVLQPEGSVSGRVLDQEGKPRVGVHVTLQGQNSDSRRYLEIKRPSDGRILQRRMSKSDSRGGFYFAGVSAGSYEVKARAETSRRTTNKTVRVEDGEIHEGVELVLGTGWTIAGQLRVPDGRAPNGLKLWLRTSNKDGSSEEAITDAEGRFRFEGLNEGLHSIRVVRQQGDKSWILRPIHKVRSGTTDLQLRLERSMSISGRVVDASGKSCRAWVRAMASNVEGKEAASLMQLADEDGEFEIHVLADFVGTLTANSIPIPNAKPASASLDGVRAGQRDLEIRLRPHR